MTEQPTSAKIDLRLYWGPVPKDDLRRLTHDHIVDDRSIVPGIVSILALAKHGGNSSLSHIAFPAAFDSGNTAGTITLRDDNLTLQDSAGTVVARATTAEKAIDPLPASSDHTPDGAEGIYERLGELGNAYGPSLQVVGDVATDGPSASGTFQTDFASAVARACASIDGGLHLLGSVAEFGRAFVLSTIEEAWVSDPDQWPSTGRIVAAIRSSSNSGLLADFDVLAPNGEALCSMRGVRLAANSTNSLSLGTTATFSLDPLRSFSRFWSAEFETRFELVDSGYGQLLHELHTGARALHPDRDAAVAYVKVDDWLRTAPRVPEVDDTIATRALPNGKVVAELNSYETDYLYNEIFVDEVYARHDIDVVNGAVVVDVGANIGLFSLFAASRADDVRILAVEPSPILEPILRANLNAHAPGATLVPAGMAEAAGRATLTFYPHSSVFSTFEPDVEAEAASIRAIVENTVRANGSYTPELIDGVTAEFMEGRTEAVSQECALVGLSELIVEHSLERIDLLKVDAEKSERGILRGIADEHWDRIQQIIVEVHWEDPHGIADVTELLESKGFSCVTDEEDLLEGSGLFTVYGRRSDRSPEYTDAASPAAKIDLAGFDENIDLFLAAVDAYIERPSPQTLFVLVPPTDTSAAVAERHERVIDELDRRNMLTLDGRSLIDTYAVETVFDPVSDSLGHVPYTQEMFAAIATHSIRFLLSTTRPPRKLLVLDCDNTLWNGTVGEDGAAGLRIDAPAATIQELARSSMERGMLLALASKNIDADVVEAFDAIPDMALSLEDMTARRVDWSPKSSNIRAMADEIGIGSDSAVFFDDSPVEIAEVRANAPEVLSICVKDRDRVDATFAAHIWELDSFVESTAEDLSRTELYKAEAQRRHLESGVDSFEKFLEQLQVRIEILPLDEDSLPRAAQMTQRTNQFNTTTIRRNENELRQLLDNGADALIASVTDRFGDYGIVGLATLSSSDDSVVVDALLMSCRVLGRGVEHAIVRHIAGDAIARGLSTVEFDFEPSDRNQPVAEFLDELANSADADRSGRRLVVAAHDVVDATFTHRTAEPATAGPSHTSVTVADSKRTERIAFELASARQIVEATRRRFERERPPELGFAAPPETTEQTALVSIWQEILGFAQIGIDDNFFQFGGNSLNAVELVSATHASSTAPDIALVDLFDRPTIRKLTTASGGGQTDDSRSRGSDRRRRAIRRPAAN